MTGLDEPKLRASAMNALAHGADSLYTSLANPVAELAALRGAKLIATALDGDLDQAGRTDLALGSILCGYAIDSAKFSLHHVICQSLVRVMRIQHAETNAAILPHALEALVPRAGKQMTALARALGTRRDALAARVEELAGGRRVAGLDRGGPVEARARPRRDPRPRRAADDARSPGARRAPALIEAAW